MQPGLVSIMMPAYNAAEYIGQAIESVLAQSYQQWELIIVDDGSTDATRAVVQRYTDARILLLHQPNRGEAVARNRALEAMQGEFVAFLDADDLFLSHHLRVTIDYLQRHPQLQGVYTDGHYCTQQGFILAPLSSWRRGPFHGWLFEELVLASDVFGPPICVVLRHSSIVQRQLHFNPAIVIGPDWDFFTRFAEAAPFGYLDQQTCLYRVHQTNITLRTAPRKRADSLAKCREVIIKLPGFSTCTIKTQAAVFYDLLVNQRRGQFLQQDDVTYWPEFAALPTHEQSRLLRLMAGKSLAYLAEQPEHARWYIDHWLARARGLNPRCVRARVLHMLFTASPRLCRALVHAKTLLQPDRMIDSPFGQFV